MKGELEARLERILEDMGIPIYCNEAMTIWKLLKEARKEFPVGYIVPVNIIELEEKGETKALAESVSIIDDEKAAKWFKKWFGSSEADADTE